MLDDERSVGSELSLDSHAFSLDEFSNVNRNNLRVRSTTRKKEAERLEVGVQVDVYDRGMFFVRTQKAGSGARHCTHIESEGRGGAATTPFYTIHESYTRVPALRIGRFMSLC